jgi:uncharacterized protein (TIGR02145 family)
MIRNRFICISISCLVLLSVIFKSCFKEQPEDPPKSPHPPDLLLYFTSVSCTSAVLIGSIRNPYELTNPDLGFYWSSTSKNPTSTDNIIDNVHMVSDVIYGHGFTDTLKRLTPSTTYFVKAFAKNNLYTTLSSPQSFTTLSAIPTVFTSPVIEYTKSNALVGGNVTYEGSSHLTDCGIYWGLSEDLITTGKKLPIGQSMGLFSYNLANLIPNTTYYIKAYASNNDEAGYGLTYKFNSGQSSDIPTIKDIDGNIYHYIKIGEQYWTVENMKTTKYNDGTDIPKVNLIYWYRSAVPAYCFYRDDSTNNRIYGALYNFYVVESGMLCPTGWHVPSDSEWSILTSNLGGENSAAIKLKEVGSSHWGELNSRSTNESFFTALPGGYRYTYDYGYSGGKGGTEDGIKNTGIWWTSTKVDDGSGWIRSMHSSDDIVTRTGSANYKGWGLSVRCVKD